MNASPTPVDAATLKAENNIAAWLSIIPGLGQIYKGHFSAGFFWMLIGVPLALWVGLLLTLATAGLSMLIPLVCWAAVAFDPYNKRDIRRHHWLPSLSDDESDESFQD